MAVGDTYELDADGQMQTAAFAATPTAQRDPRQKGRRVRRRLPPRIATIAQTPAPAPNAKNEEQATYYGSHPFEQAQQDIVNYALSLPNEYNPQRGEVPIPRAQRVINPDGSETLVSSTQTDAQWLDDTLRYGVHPNQLKPTERLEDNMLHKFTATPIEGYVPYVLAMDGQIWGARHVKSPKFRERLKRSLLDQGVSEADVEGRLDVLIPQLQQRIATTPMHMFSKGGHRAQFWHQTPEQAQSAAEERAVREKAGLHNPSEWNPYAISPRGMFAEGRVFVRNASADEPLGRLGAHEYRHALGVPRTIGELVNPSVARPSGIGQIVTDPIGTVTSIKDNALQVLNDPMLTSPQMRVELQKMMRPARGDESITNIKDYDKNPIYSQNLNEVAARVWDTRYMGARAGIFNPDTENFTIEHLRKMRDANLGSIKHLIDLFGSEENVVKVMNMIAQQNNNSVPDNYV